jgi:phospholipid/cholesterol/gamma-HCH transport system permease protein
MQGASELRRFGALRYVVDLVAVGFTRELGPLLTAIAVSGLSGSAFAAEIGTMKVTEERRMPRNCLVGTHPGSF